MLMKKMCVGHKIAWVLVLVGALNWGLVGGFDVNLVMMLFGKMAWLERTVYVLVGLSAIMMLGMHKCCVRGGKCASCGKDGHMCEEEKPMEAKTEQKP